MLRDNRCVINIYMGSTYICGQRLCDQHICDSNLNVINIYLWSTYLCDQLLFVISHMCLYELLYEDIYLTFHFRGRRRGGRRGARCRQGGRARCVLLVVGRGVVAARVARRPRVGAR